MTADPPRSETTARAVAFVAERREEAEQLGHALADLVHDPEGFARELEAGFARLADPEYLEGERRIAPGLGPVLGVRWPLNAAVARGFRAEIRGVSPSALLFIADRLYRSTPLEIRWFAFGILEQLVKDEPERTWQLLRRGSREAGDWITVDTLAHPYGRGILLESVPLGRARAARVQPVALGAPPGRLDHRHDAVHGPAARPRAGCRRPRPGAHRRPDGRCRARRPEGTRLGAPLADRRGPGCRRGVRDRRGRDRARDADGHRAWVVRDTLHKLPAASAADLRARLDGIRRRPGAPSTSRAAATAAQFAGMGLGRDMPEPPLT